MENRRTNNIKDGSKVTPITSNYLKDTTIKAFDKAKTSETTEGIWQKQKKAKADYIMQI